MTTMLIAPTVRPNLTKAEAMAAPVGDGLLDVLLGRADTARARKLQARYRMAFGYIGGPRPVLTEPDAQPKAGKNEIPTYTLMLSPERSVGIPGVNLCPKATVGCCDGCLGEEGHGSMSHTKKSRMVRTSFLLHHPYETGVIMGAELRLALRKHGRIGFRPDCTSDLRWERMMRVAIERFHDLGVQWYDYSAWDPVDRDTLDGRYHYTYSMKENHDEAWLHRIIGMGMNVAVPFEGVRKGQPLPTEFMGVRCIDGDVTDWRPGDPSGVVVALRKKGHAPNKYGFFRATQ